MVNRCSLAIGACVIQEKRECGYCALTICTIKSTPEDGMHLADSLKLIQAPYIHFPSSVLLVTDKTTESASRTLELRCISFGG